MNSFDISGRLPEKFIKETQCDSIYSPRGIFSEKMLKDFRGISEYISENESRMDFLHNFGGIFGRISEGYPEGFQ